VATGRIAELLPAGPDLAGWLAISQVDELEEGALAGVAAAYRRLASWAQAGELAAVAQLASRSAASDPRVGIDDHGRPSRIPADAYGQVSLALTMSQSGASWWTDLAVTLRWRLTATGAALRDGTIDLARARAIADATAVLDDEKAQAVEAKVLPKAADQTTGQLRAALRRAVISADPEGAERRREEAERQAKVMLYPDAEGTASLSGQRLPGIRAAAAMARITALARALKASGADGGIDLLRAKVYLGLLLGTLPYIPPSADAPPDACPPDDDPPDDDPPDDDPPDDGRPDDSPPAEENPPPYGPPDDCPPMDGSPNDCSPMDSPPEDRWPDDCPADSDLADDEPPSPDSDCPPHGNGSTADLSVPWPRATAILAPGPAAMGNLTPAGSGFLELSLSWRTLACGGSDPGAVTRLGAITPDEARYLARLAADDPAVEWRVVVSGADGQVAVSRVKRGPARARSTRADAGDHARAGPGDHAGLVRRVTVTFTPDDFSVLACSAPACSAQGCSAPACSAQACSAPACSAQACSAQACSASAGQSELTELLSAVAAAGQEAAGRAAERAAADAAAGGCAHAGSSAAYEPPPRLREFVSQRDLTCRFPTCRQPASRCDLDHTAPYDQGGLTCTCNLGALCRYHHQLKQQPGWQLSQPTPGSFIWTTPTGRSYLTDAYLTDAYLTDALRR
jgi:hypothetical protein